MSSIRQVLRAAVEAARATAHRRRLHDGPRAALIAAGHDRASRRRPEHGDYATNAAMQLAPIARMAPMRIAEALVAALELPDGMGSAEVAPPGFINIRLDPGWVGAPGRGDPASRDRTTATCAVDNPRSVNVEFVSANPTGPLTLGNARGAFVGDLLCRVLEAVGHRRDARVLLQRLQCPGPQPRPFGARAAPGRADPRGRVSRRLRDRPGGGLPDEVWEAATAEGADAGEILGRWASERVRAGIEESLQRLGVHFDVWTSEGSLYRDDWVARAVDAASAIAGTSMNRTAPPGSGRRLSVTTRTASCIGPTDSPPTSRPTSGTWPRSSRAASTSSSTCGAKITTAPWHATGQRRRHLGFDADAVHWLLMAWVRFVRDGVDIGMSKRAGEFVTLDELLAEIGPDAARWFFGSRATTTGIDFDIELAKRQSNENPVYYVQYAHARCSSILRNAREREVHAATDEAASLLRHPAEQALIRELLRLPDVVSDAADRRETHEIPKYCLEVAGLFSQFYRDCRVLTDDPEESRFSACARCPRRCDEASSWRMGSGRWASAHRSRCRRRLPEPGHRAIDDRRGRSLHDQADTIRNRNEPARDVEPRGRLPIGVGELRRVRGRVPGDSPRDGDRTAGAAGRDQAVTAPARRRLPRCTVSRRPRPWSQ